MVFFPLASYFLADDDGWASAPYDQLVSSLSAACAKMALAGPAANFLLAVIAAVAVHIGIGLACSLA